MRMQDGSNPVSENESVLMQMTLREKIAWYLRHRGFVALCFKGLEVLTGGWIKARPIANGAGIASQELSSERIESNEQIKDAATDVVMSGQNAHIQRIDRDDLDDRVFFRQKALGVYPAQPGVRQVVMVTDSIGKGSLFGGVATSIILSALVAKKTSLPLRIVTREEAAIEGNIGVILKNACIQFDGDVHFSFVPVRDNLAKVAISPHDIIITTSWWTTESVKNALGTRNVFYLLQEDERMFYPLNDEHLRCSELLSDRSLNILINSELLYKHLNHSGLPSFGETAIWFEPAFPHALKQLPAEEQKSKMDFFFYARPNHARNLFYRGVDVVQAALDRGVLDPKEWNLHFVGVSMPELSLGEGVSLQTHATLDWAGYLDLMKRMDLGLSLMYTPHPSYPPLDLAASGAVAVTNRCGVKRDLLHYSHNIICADTDVDSMVDALAEGVALAKDRYQREQNLQKAGLGISWEDNLSGAVDFIMKRSCND